LVYSPIIRGYLELSFRDWNEKRHYIRIFKNVRYICIPYIFNDIQNKLLQKGRNILSILLLMVLYLYIYISHVHISNIEGARVSIRILLEAGLILLGNLEPCQ